MMNSSKNLSVFESSPIPKKLGSKLSDEKGISHCYLNLKNFNHVMINKVNKIVECYYINLFY